MYLSKASAYEIIILLQMKIDQMKKSVSRVWRWEIQAI
jgi:hypothetical protein